MFQSSLFPVALVVSLTCYLLSPVVPPLFIFALTDFGFATTMKNTRNRHAVCSPTSAASDARATGLRRTRSARACFALAALRPDDAGTDGAMRHVGGDIASRVSRATGWRSTGRAADLRKGEQAVPERAAAVEKHVERLRRSRLNFRDTDAARIIIWSIVDALCSFACVACCTNPDQPDVDTALILRHCADNDGTDCPSSCWLAGIADSAPSHHHFIALKATCLTERGIFSGQLHF